METVNPDSVQLTVITDLESIVFPNIPEVAHLVQVQFRGMGFKARNVTACRVTVERDPRTLATTKSKVAVYDRLEYRKYEVASVLGDEDLELPEEITRDENTMYLYVQYDVDTNLHMEV